MGKILLWIAIGLTAVSAVLGILNHSKLSSAQTRVTETESQLVSLKENGNKSIDQVKGLNDKIAALTKDKEQAAAEVTSAKSEAQAATQQLKDLQTQSGDKESQLTQLKSDSDAKDKKIAELEASKNTPAPNPEFDKVKQELEEQKQVAQSALDKLKGMDSQMTELQTYKKERISRTMQNGLEGSIVAVNPAWNFVILSLGDRNGIVSNTEMLIKRGSQFIGKVHITSVERSTSVADIVSNSVPKGLTVQPGDKVIYQKSSEGEN
ncbi:MAG: hypothetical protein ABIP97_04305 [Chthoniobacterales bacterium]